jgi:UV DNA damage endonuclease
MNLSLCCISNILSEQGIKFRTMTFKSYSSKPKEESLQKLSEIIRNNFRVSRLTIQHCFDNGIRGYRLSSDITPIITHPDVNLSLEELPDFNLIQYEINELKKTIINTKIRVSAHPSEYITLTSENPTAINNSIVDLESHANLFDRLDLPKDYNSPLNIHIRKDGDPDYLSLEFMKNFEKLSHSVKSRLVLENNDTGNTWSINNLIKYFYHPYKIPITFDNLHHEFLSHDSSYFDAFYNAKSTWNTTPIFHYSEGKNNSRAHADMPTSIPESFNEDILWDVELKNKDYAILHILNSL